MTCEQLLRSCRSSDRRDHGGQAGVTPALGCQCQERTEAGSSPTNSRSNSCSAAETE